MAVEICKMLRRFCLPPVARGRADLKRMKRAPHRKWTGAPGSPKRTWAENDLFQMLSPECSSEAGAQKYCFRWSEKRSRKASPYRFQPTNAEANLVHPYLAFFRKGSDHDRCHLRLDRPCCVLPHPICIWLDLERAGSFPETDERKSARWRAILLAIRPKGGVRSARLTGDTDPIHLIEAAPRFRKPPRKINPWNFLSPVCGV